MTKYKIGDHVVHGREVGQIREIIKDFRGMGDYYRIQSLHDESLFVMTPVDTKKKTVRSIISKDDAEKLINEISSIETIEFEQRNAESIYNNLIKSGDHHDMIRLIKTSYEKCADRTKKGLARNEKDKMFLRMGERLLYSEMAVALGKSYDDTKQYVINRVRELTPA